MSTREEIETLDTNGICDMLSNQIEDIDFETLQQFISNKVNGKAFVLLTESDLCELVPKLGERKHVQKLVESFQPKSTQSHVSQT